MDEIYDVYLKTLPETLPEALQRAQQVKEEIYDKYINRIAIIKAEQEDGGLEFQTETIKQEETKQQVTLRKSLVDSQELVERLSERRFSNLSFHELNK